MQASDILGYKLYIFPVKGDLLSFWFCFCVLFSIAIILKHVRKMAALKAGSSRASLGEGHSFLMSRVDTLEQENRELRERVNQLMINVDDLSRPSR